MSFDRFLPGRTHNLRCMVIFGILLTRKWSKVNLFLKLYFYGEKSLILNRPKLFFLISNSMSLNYSALRHMFLKPEFQAK